MGFPNKWVFPKKGPHPKAKEDNRPDKHQKKRTADTENLRRLNRGAEFSLRKVENKERPTKNNDRLELQELPEDW